MLINQDFAQIEPKSPAKRELKLVKGADPEIEKSDHRSDFNRDAKLLQETIVKIDGA
jgi:site-specific recombinase XerD